MDKQSMLLTLLKHRRNSGYVSFGSIWNKGETTGKVFVLKNEKGEILPVQSRTTAFWPDGSIKWAAHVADAAKMGKQVSIELLDEAKGCNAESELTQRIMIDRKQDGLHITTACLSFIIPADKSCLFHSLYLKGIKMIRQAYPVMWLEHPLQEEDTVVRKEECCGRGIIENIIIEEKGPLQSVFRLEGIHIESQSQRRVLPFICRIYVSADSDKLKFVYTFLYDGDKNNDFLKGIGIRFQAELTGMPYDRHVRFDTDNGGFHEAALLLCPSHPKLPKEIFAAQLDGITGFFPGNQENSFLDQMPVWSDFGICQDSSEHFYIYKRTKNGCCYLNCCHGRRSNGVMMAGGANGSLLFGIRDFWQRYPGGMEIHGLEKELTECTAWFYSPKAAAYDFRHYDTRAYPRTCYEGYSHLGDDPDGIAVTEELSLQFLEKTASCEDMENFGSVLNKPPVYTGTPEYYHDKRAFGCWSLLQKKTTAQKWLEEQLDKAFSFYKEEIEARKWYGIFDYGDIMHTYDSARHVWKYDMGGFAWQNTELVPTYWLWLYFMRTGREDVFSMAEAMNRHCSEIDIYHTGPLKGMGSRHNVRHWGCPCKEPRIAMAGHWRFYYYLTGDHRTGEIMAEVKDADAALYHTEHYWEGSGADKELVIRSGPDWSSYVANWMTQYERTLDSNYRKKIEQGIQDIRKAPYGFASGPEYGYDPDTSRLIYRGENESTPNQHLQLCMGEPQIWLECAQLLEDDTLERLLTELGCFYLLSPEEKRKATDGKIEKRPFSWPMLASGVIAYAAMRKQDSSLALQAWKLLFEEIETKFVTKGFEPMIYTQDRDGYQRKELPQLMTNSASQWCLNVIMCLEFIPEALEQAYAAGTVRS